MNFNLCCCNNPPPHFLSDDGENKETPEDSDDEEEDDEDEDDTEVKEENGVLVLTDGNYDAFMEGKDTVLVEFYAPWYVLPRPLRDPSAL